MTTEAPILTPGAMEHTITRELPDGTSIEFESAPAGWLTKAGEPRIKPWRAYHATPEGPCPICDGTGRIPGKREGTTKQCPPCGATGKPSRARWPSVTTFLDAVCPKPGLAPWYEANGILGGVEAIRRGIIDLEDPDLDAVRIVRENRLGAERARDVAADRGLNIHDILEAWMTTGAVPNPADHPASHRGFIQGLVRFLISHDPEPVAVEQLVAHPREKYAGRTDLVARIQGRLTRLDLKTQERGSIFNTAHVQVRLYEDAEVAAGGEPCDDLLVVVVDASGGFRSMACMATQVMAHAALEFARELQPITYACDAANRAEREARAAA